MHTEQTLVTRALLGFCALGVISAVVPVVALVLLVLLGLALVGGLVMLAMAWYATRFEAPEPAAWRESVREVA